MTKFLSSSLLLSLLVTTPALAEPAAPSQVIVRTIDLDSTGVWTSGRTEEDAQLARRADEADRASRAQRQQDDDSRAVGS